MIEPLSSKITNLVEVVPWSIEPINLGIINNIKYNK
jgi:hypothetical protein